MSAPIDRVDPVDPIEPVEPADAIADWTCGGAGLAYQQCAACDHRWYFRRGFCPRCGEAGPTTHASGGRGVVYATTLVQRAPSEAFAALAPYRIVLVDLDEGIRVMAHGDAELRIGDTVVCRFDALAGRMLPRFEQA
ncbi:MAG: OB-fold domain-containing protein [Burkholderiaceae bacterium]